LIELALAHQEGRGNVVARAYDRSDAVERRRALMQQWGAFFTSAGVTSDGVQFYRPGDAAKTKRKASTAIVKSIV
jgi:hypothetical protein